jgi:hypothetical protein
MRARSLKPGFFKNEKLAEMPPLTRLFFAGLWCAADRDGRLEDRPRRLKAEILAFDNANVEKMLDELAAGADPFLVRYEAKGSRFIQILNFQKHQNPHVREAHSTIPAPGQHSASTRQAPGETGSSTEVAALTPSFLTPHSLTPVAEGGSTGPAPGSREKPVNGNGTTLWNQIRRLIEPQASPTSRRWLSTVRQVSESDVALRLAVPTQEAASLLTGPASQAIDEALATLRPNHRLAVNVELLPEDLE